LFSCHTPEHVDPSVDLLIHSDAVPADNPELIQGDRLGVPRLSYPQAVGALSAGLHMLAVAGTHGKSTTAAMLTHVLVRAGQDPLVLAGAAPLGRTSAARTGAGRVAVVEACEYRANFLHLLPTQAVILNIEPDHFDSFPTLADLEEAFARFAAILPEDGRLLVPADCPHTRRAARHSRARVETFGLEPSADWSARAVIGLGGYYQFELCYRRRLLDRVRLRVPGRHNVLNALAAAALALGPRGGPSCVSPAAAAVALSGFAGLGRRLELCGRLDLQSGAKQGAVAAWPGRLAGNGEAGENGRPSNIGPWQANGETTPNGRTLLNGQTLLDGRTAPNGPAALNGWTAPSGREVILVDDYAHLPAEIASGLLAVREQFPDRRLWCVFQPHQASRTARLLDEMAASLDNADQVVIAEIFRAREGPPVRGEVTAADLRARLCRRGREVPAVYRADQIVRLLAERLEPGDIVVTMGAGDIRKVQHGLAHRL